MLGHKAVIAAFWGCVLVLLSSSGTFAWDNGQEAAQVVGQADLVSSTAATTATGLNGAISVAIDPVNDKLYVVDGYNSRVLRYAYPIQSNQPTAELVFGQADFTSAVTGLGQNSFDGPREVLVDGEGRLWVSDFGNKRVLWFNNAHAIVDNQPNADGVLGQPDFTTKNIEITASSIGGPYGMAISSSGTLFVADAEYSRVLRFDAAAQKANGASADGVLGQPDFVTEAAFVDVRTLSSCRGVALMGSALFVADRLHARVLRFDNAASKANGADADGVLGQSDFVSSSANLTQSGMETPSRLAVDPYGRLYVSDGFNYDRVLVFDDAASLSNGADASAVLGQVDFTTSGSGTTASLLSLDSSGGGMAFDSENNRLILADTLNNRVLQFNDPDDHPTDFPWMLFVPSAITGQQP